MNQLKLKRADYRPDLTEFVGRPLDPPKLKSLGSRNRTNDKSEARPQLQLSAFAQRTQSDVRCFDCKILPRRFVGAPQERSAAHRARFNAILSSDCVWEQ